MFCPDCKSILMPTSIDGKRVLSCSCGYSQEGKGATFSEKNKNKEDKIIILDGEESPNVKIEATCPKCNHNEAEYWEVQTRAADEPPTRFHRCTKCKHTWREYK